MKRRRLLIAEDDANIRTGLVDVLESEGYEVLAANDGQSALALAKQGGFDLILLDVMMPALSGYEVCREVRRRDSRVPVIMLTAKGEEIDKVVGLELGADDYITKPFGVRELLARIAAVLRRSGPQEEAEPESEPFDFGTARIDPKRMEAVVGGEAVALTPREMKLVQYFHRHPGEALSRDALLNAAWGIDYLGTTRTLDQHMAQLRKKLESDPARPGTLLTVHGHGYRYEPGA
ncbi:response regulator transcription factor [Ruficoccus amylovorans]|uniref:Response regulator transcription factor n=1 Tax=Ruficoccus amylovorans TaxID=1804625 RepID=A0A842HED3_9BACT|nr:response regulator transcription factor [Ruficoccus amylovorans]MBC2593937.1 response regulator transcription factor [Ruficoccus amylovorans]